MEGYEMSQGERRALQAIEDTLRLEASGLDRRLREMTPGLWLRLRRRAGQPLAGLAILFGVASAVLLVTAMRSSSIGVVWGFAACWTATLLTTAVVSRSAAARRQAPAG
ncbi:DUF3040 domain-containing protein [Streptomyces sp. SL13]|uniref:DUF3040 domain-containing protein n=1 Tax=Streptantibioticus silvisoli TaxID=2705255 RepID=A0AA90GWJ1_9ACTN|nr:DUF3040 domain-containing protein [Streptantibioticus silvisoli]MDI5962557.1 DUF3040 domain-containing protein [Streptantibioticus silvisoli]MDI5969189.1 DUF3040 domain-containing protein [Streptantibioticus silvisoli]